MNTDKNQSILSYIMNLLTKLTFLLILLNVFLLSSVGFVYTHGSSHINHGFIFIASFMLYSLLWLLMGFRLN
ncbi:hypothetical protein [Cytobacillus sp. FSL R7-0680]|uniref:hypothetical protein n=1 Tax=Cytobacillus sp. FSL R7-0680 TaxID=2921689 RepID=UPI0030F8BB6A